MVMWGNFSDGMPVIEVAVPDFNKGKERWKI